MSRRRPRRRAPASVPAPRRTSRLPAIPGTRRRVRVAPRSSSASSFDGRLRPPRRRHGAHHRCVRHEPRRGRVRPSGQRTDRAGHAAGARDRLEQLVRRAAGTPLTLELLLDGDATWIPVVAPGGTGPLVPPCMGSGQATNLSVTGFQPVGTTADRGLIVRSGVLQRLVDDREQAPSDRGCPSVDVRRCPRVLGRIQRRGPSRSARRGSATAGPQFRPGLRSGR